MTMELSHAELSLTVDNGVYKGQKNAHGSKMWQPFG